MVHYFLLVLVSLVVSASAVGCREKSALKWPVMCRLSC